MNKIKKSETEWKKLLDEKTYNITRKSGTEQAFTGKYLHEKSNGIYSCICCGNYLFSSDANYFGAISRDFVASGVYSPQE